LAASFILERQRDQRDAGLLRHLRRLRKRKRIPIRSTTSSRGESVAGTLKRDRTLIIMKTSCSICFRILVYEDASTEALNYLNHGVFIIWNTTAPGALVTGSFDRVYSLSDLTRLLAGKSRTVKPHSSARWPKTVKMIAEYLEHALQFERMAADEKNPELKAQLERQAAAYRKLAAERAKKLGLQPPPSGPKNAN